MNASRNDIVAAAREVRDSEAGKALSALMRLRIEELKDDLLSADPAYAGRLQGAAAELLALLRLIENDQPLPERKDDAYA